LGESYEQGLHPLSAFMIMPVFAFANTGVPLADLTFDDLMQPLTLGVALGLFVSKQFGIFGLVWLAVKAGLASKLVD
jgi:NhaA family Na+:H+ antiporter